MIFGISSFPNPQFSFVSVKNRIMSKLVTLPIFFLSRDNHCLTTMSISKVSKCFVWHTHTYTHTNITLYIDKDFLWRAFKYTRVNSLFRCNPSNQLTRFSWLTRIGQHCNYFYYLVLFNSTFAEQNLSATFISFFVFFFSKVWNLID